MEDAVNYKCRTIQHLQTPDGHFKRLSITHRFAIQVTPELTEKLSGWSLKLGSESYYEPVGGLTKLHYKALMCTNFAFTEVPKPPAPLRLYKPQPGTLRTL